MIVRSLPSFVSISRFTGRPLVIGTFAVADVAGNMFFLDGDGLTNCNMFRVSFRLRRIEKKIICFPLNYNVLLFITEASAPKTDKPANVLTKLFALGGWRVGIFGIVDFTIDAVFAVPTFIVFVDKLTKL